MLGLLLTTMCFDFMGQANSSYAIDICPKWTVYHIRVHQANTLPNHVTMHSFAAISAIFAATQLT